MKKRLPVAAATAADNSGRGAYTSAGALADPQGADLPVSSGTCRVCGCTDARACLGGCAWVDPEHTVCSACLDRRFYIAKGRASGAGATQLVDRRTGYRRHYMSAREAARAAVALLAAGRKTRD